VSPPLNWERAIAFPCLKRGAATILIEILKHPSKAFEVRVIDGEGRTIQMSTYPTIVSARRAARAWTVRSGV
jgi:hypothetical protein